MKVEVSTDQNQDLKIALAEELFNSTGTASVVASLIREHASSIHQACGMQETDSTTIKDFANSLEATHVLDETQTKILLGNRILSSDESFQAIAALMKAIRIDERGNVDVCGSIVKDLQTESLISLVRKMAHFAEELESPSAHMAFLQAQRKDFINRYQIEYSSNDTYHDSNSDYKGIVGLNLVDTSRIDFLYQAQIAAREIHGINAIDFDQLNDWTSDSRFQTAPKSELRIIAADRKTSFLNTEGQLQRGYLGTTVENLAVAHAAFLVATGNNVFQHSYSLRTTNGTLHFDEDRGLKEVEDSGRYGQYVRAAREI